MPNDDEKELLQHMTQIQLPTCKGRDHMWVYGTYRVWCALCRRSLHEIMQQQLREAGSDGCARIALHPVFGPGED